MENNTSQEQRFVEEPRVEDPKPDESQPKLEEPKQEAVAQPDEEPQPEQPKPDEEPDEGRKPEEPEEEPGSQLTMILVLTVIGATVGSGLTMGYNIGVCNNPQEFIIDFIEKTSDDRDSYKAGMSRNAAQNVFAFAVSIFCITAPIGALGGSIFAQRFGRKSCLLWNNFFLLASVLFQSTCVEAKAYELFIIGRAFAGINTGVNAAVCPMYLSEISPTKIRGAVGGCFQLSVVIGILVSQILGFNSIIGGKDSWPWLFAVILLFGAVQVGALWCCPESPYFLYIQRGDQEESRRALQRLRGRKADVSSEMNTIQQEDKKLKSEPEVKYRDLVDVRHLRKPLVLSLMTMVAQQLSGINAIMYYSSPIFESALDEKTVVEKPDAPKYLVAAVGAWNLVCTIVTMPLIDRAGRKTLMLAGLGCMASAALIAALMLGGVATSEGQECRGIVRENDASNAIAITMVFVYVGGFAIGPGPIPWLIVPELFSAGARSKAVAVSTTTNWLANAAVAYLFPVLQGAMCGWVFLVFVATCVGFFLYFLFFLPEVKGLTFVQIQALFDDRRRQSSRPNLRRDDLQPILENDKSPANES